VAFGVLPAWAGGILNAVRASGDGSRDLSESKVAWALLGGALPVLVVCMVLGAVIALLVAWTQSAGSTPTRLDAVPPAEAAGAVGRRRPILLLSGLALTGLLLWASPRSMFYPILGTAAAWVLTLAMRRSPAAGYLLLGGLLGSVAQFVQISHTNQVPMLSYLMRWGALGIIVAVLFGTLQALGPTLLVLGLGSRSIAGPARPT
jgi:hypothetical protein